MEADAGRFCSIEIDPIEAVTIEAVALYKARETLVTSVISLVAGTPAVEVTWGIVVGFVVISLAIEAGEDVGAKIVPASGGTT